MQTTNYKDRKEKPSELFRDVATYSGGLCQRECACGRLYFVDGAEKGDYDEGELEGLLVRLADDNRVFVRFESIPTANLDNTDYVTDCQCNALSRYETFIWEHRDIIAEYLVKRTKQEVEASAREAERMAVLSTLRFNPEGE